MSLVRSAPAQRTPNFTKQKLNLHMIQVRVPLILHSSTTYLGSYLGFVEKRKMLGFEG